MLIREEMESDQSHPRGRGWRKLGRIPTRLGKAEDRGHGLLSRATFQAIPWKRISIKKEQDKGKL